MRRKKELNENAGAKPAVTSKVSTAGKAKKYSYADFTKMEDRKNYEMVEGELYVKDTPVVSEQMMMAEIYAQLHEQLKGKKNIPFIAPLNVTLSESKEEDSIYNVVQPDIFVCDKSKIGEKKISGSPDFVVEISSSNAEYDMLTKMKLYQEYKVKEYWIVNPKEKLVLPYCLNKRGVFEVSDKIYNFEEEIPVKTLPGCVINLQDIYHEKQTTGTATAANTATATQAETKTETYRAGGTEEFLLTTNGAFKGEF